MEASPLPIDVLLQILARSDPSTVARCGATCKLLRRHVTDPAFLCRLCRGSADQFLIALIYHRHIAFRFPWKKLTRRQPVFAPSRSFAGGQPPKSVVANLKSQLDGPYNPVASRGGLLVLRSEEGASRLICVCNPVSGRRRVLPPNKLISDDLYVVMPEDHGGNGGHDMPFKFKLLVADALLWTQTYSSETGAWGRVTSTREASVPPSYQQVQASQVVLGGVAHWLYHEPYTWNFHVLALDVGTGQAEWIVVPEDLHRQPEMSGELLLVSSPDGKLGLLVWERPVAVTMWTMAAADAESGRSWTRRVVIEWETIFQSVNPLSNYPLACHLIKFAWFAQGSGTVVFQMNCVGIVTLNLRTLEVRHLQRTQVQLYEPTPFCVYELDLAKLLPSR